MKRYISLLLVLTALSCLLWAFCAAAEQTDGPALIPEPAQLTLYKDGTAALSYTLVNAEGMPAAEETWTVSDPAVVSVKKGAITGRNAGTATVTCTLLWPDGTSCSAAYEITVLVAVSGVKTGSDKMILFAGGPGAAIEYSVRPQNASCREVHWTSSDPSVAAVDGTGFVTPLKPGKTTVTAASDEDPAKKASVTVTVRQPVTSIGFDQPYVEIAKGNTLRLSPKVMPANASYQKLNWESSDRSVATVRNGVLEAKGTGTAVIRCIAADGSGTEATFTVEVYPPVKSVRVAPAQAKIYLGREPLQLTATVLPADAKYPAVRWVSADTRIATVDGNGLVTPVAPGKVTVTVVSVDDGTKKGGAVITVMKPVSSVTLDRESGELEKGTAVRLLATVLPGDATNRTLIWTSSDPSVASVSNGTVLGKAPGTAVITATAADGSGTSAIYVVYVKQSVTGIRFAGTKATVSEGAVLRLTPAIDPADASDTRLRWTGSDPRVAAVDAETGEITGVSTGACTVTAYAQDGSGKSASVTVQVEPAVPIHVEGFERRGKNGGLYEFQLTFKSLTRYTSIRTVGYTLAFSYGGRTYTRSFTVNVGPLGPGASKKAAWREVGYQLTFAEDYRILLTSVQFADGSWIYYNAETLIGRFDG